MSGHEIERREAPALVVNPATGEALDLTVATNLLGMAIEDAKAMEAALRSYKREIADELLRRMDRETTYTYRGGGLKITGDGPREPDYDGDKLHEALKPHVAAGTISREASEAAAKPTFKPMKGGIKKLVKLGGDVAAAVKTAEVPNNKPRGVSVSPDG